MSINQSTESLLEYHKCDSAVHTHLVEDRVAANICMKVNACARTCFKAWAQLGCFVHTNRSCKVRAIMFKA
jgi:hypothetical protein